MSIPRLMQSLVDAQKAVQSFAHVEYQDDPAIPGKRAYSIGGSTAAAVQAEIDRHMRVVEMTGGVGEFLNPMSLADAARRYGSASLFMEAPFVSLGYTIIAKEAA